MNPTVPNDLTIESQIAIQALRQSAIACQAIQKQLVPEQSLAKQDKSPVTTADYASQAIVCSHLATAFPNDSVVAEEASALLKQSSHDAMRAIIRQHVGQVLGKAITDTQLFSWIDRGSSPGKADRFWTLDPIDGTKGFLRRDQYAIALALIQQGQIALSALACPNLLDPQGHRGVLLLAQRGQGVHRIPLLPQPIDNPMTLPQVATVTLANTRLCESFESGHSDQDASALIAQELGLTAKPVRMDSQAKYAALALGQAEIYLRLPRSIEYREMIWDHAAGALAVMETGGTVTDIHGQPLDFSQGRRLENNLGIVATRGNFHSKVVQAVQKYVKV